VAGPGQGCPRLLADTDTPIESPATIKGGGASRPTWAGARCPRSLGTPLRQAIRKESRSLGKDFNPLELKVGFGDSYLSARFCQDRRSSNWTSTIRVPGRYTSAGAMDDISPLAGRSFYRQVFLVWLGLMVLSAFGVWGIGALAPWILLRDQTKSSWHFVELGWKTLDDSGSAFGTPEYVEAARKAEPYFHKAVEVDPEEGKYRIDLARILHAQQRYEEAYEEAGRGIEFCDPKDCFAHGFLGELALRVGKLEEAEEHLRIATELDSGNPWHRERLATALLERGKVDEGIEVWRKRLEELPAVPASRTRAAWAAAKAGRWQEAADWFTVCAQEGMKLGENWLALAVARAAVGDVDGAAVAFAQYGREQGVSGQGMPDLSGLGLPPLDTAVQQRLRAAYRRGFAARWR